MSILFCKNTVQRFLTALFLLLLLAAPAHAHRVNVFGWVEDGQIRAEAAFSSGRAAMESNIRIENPATGDVAVSGKTDREGAWSTPIPDFAAKNGARLVIDAGGGHRGEWMMEPQEFSGAAPAATGEAVTEPTTDTAQFAEATAEQAPAAGGGGQAVQVVLPPDFEQRFDRAIERGVALALARQQAKPGIHEILGGLGWIFGLMGVAAYFRYRKN